MTVLAATDWKTNAELIADVAKLGYLRKDWVTLDPTFGKGIWWQLWRPDNLYTYNREIDGSDFRSLPDENDTYDAIAFDPPYVALGGRKTSNIPDMTAGYGLITTPKSPAELQDLINDGMEEMYRLVKPGGIILCKCMDYISSGQFWNGTYLTQEWAIEKLGLRQVDRFTHLGHPGPQPGGRTRKCPSCKGLSAAECRECDGKGSVLSVQQHARQNISTLFVFTKPKGKP